MNDIVHKARANYFEREAAWSLAPDALVSELAGQVTRCPYGEIAEVRLSYDPTRFDRKRYRCDVTRRGGDRLTIRSSHFAGIASFEDRAATYTPLVRALIARVAAANPHCSFRAGKRPLVFWAEQLFLLAMAALLVFVLAALGGSGLSDLVLLKLALVAALVPLALAYARRNRPRRFSPTAIPEELLP